MSDSNSIATSGTTTSNSQATDESSLPTVSSNKGRGTLKIAKNLMNKESQRKIKEYVATSNVLYIVGVPILSSHSNHCYWMVQSHHQKLFSLYEVLHKTGRWTEG